MHVEVEIVYLPGIRIRAETVEGVYNTIGICLEWLPEQGEADKTLTLVGSPRDLHAIGEQLCALALAHHQPPKE